MKPTIANISGAAKLLRRLKQGRLSALATGPDEFTLYREHDGQRMGVAIVTATATGAVVKIMDSSVVRSAQTFLYLEAPCTVSQKEP